MQSFKIFIGIMLLLLLTVCGGGIDKNEVTKDRSSDKTGIVNTDAVKVRKSADTEAEVIALLQEGATVNIIVEENGFYQIRITYAHEDDSADVYGYVKKEFVSLETAGKY